MKWFDIWIDKQYLKRYPELNPRIPLKNIMEVREIKPTDVYAILELPERDLSRLSEDDIYMQILSHMLPYIKRYIEVRCEYLSRFNAIRAEAKIKVCPPYEPYKRSLFEAIRDVLN